MNNNRDYFNDDLPQALTKEENKKLFQLAKNSDKDSKKILKEKNLRLVGHIIKKYQLTNNLIDKDDLMVIGTFGLMRAVDTFDFEKGYQFTTYATRCIENEILGVLRIEAKRIKNNISLNEVLNSDKNGNERIIENYLISNKNTENDYIRDETILIVRDSLKILDNLERQVIELRYGFKGERLSQEKTGKILNYSQKYISKIEAKARTKLAKYLEKLGQGYTKKKSKTLKKQLQ